jgi:hypothetical protein
MPSREQRAEEIRRRIAEVLRRDWDPIGVRDEPAAQDEYDAYVGGIYRLLATGASARQIAEHLAQVEAKYLGFEDINPKALIPVAEKLLEVNVRLDPH